MSSRMTYMKLAGVETGLLINFNVTRLKLGIKALCSLTPSCSSCP